MRRVRRDAGGFELTLALLAVLAAGCGGGGGPTDAGTDGARADGTGPDGASSGGDATDASRDGAAAPDRPAEESASGADVAGVADGRADGADGSSGDAGGGSGDGGGGSGDAGGDAAAAPRFQPVGCAATRVLAQSASPPLGVFPVAEGIIVVWGDLIQLVGRDGAERKNVRLARPATAAAFDGEWLAVADAAVVSSFGPDLQARGTITLKEPCETGVIVSAQRFICGPPADSDRIYYSYDLVQKALIGSSSRYTYSGRHMRRVGDLDAFVTIGSASFSPRDFYLFEVSPLGRPLQISDSPYHGDFAVNEVLAFTGRPAWHLVTSEGLMLEVFPDRCRREASPGLGNNCLVRNGALGTLRARERYLALANDPDGKLVAMVARARMTPPVGPSPAMTVCGEGCRAQQIDVATRQVVGEWPHDLPIKNVLTSAADSTCKMMVLGYEQEAAAGGGYRVALLEHGGALPEPAVPPPAPLAEDDCAVGRVLRDPRPPVAAFPIRAGVLVVLEDELLRMGRKGNVLVRRPWPRPITRALMDGERLVVVDQALLTVLDANLVVQGSVPLVESCPQALSAPRGRMVCVPGGRGIRSSIYIYDLTGPSLLARSEAPFSGTDGLKSIPGLPWLINRDQLLEVGEDGTLRARQSFSPFEMQHPLPPVFSAGNPASLVVDSRGGVFRPNPGCMPTCLQRVGAWSGPLFGGSVQGAVDGPENTLFYASPYGVSRVDAMTGMVLSRGPTLMNQGELVSAVHDARCKSMTLAVKGYETSVVDQAAYEGGMMP